MNNISNRYNFFLITIFVFAPFIAYFPTVYFDISFNKIMQFLSFLGVALLFIFRDKSIPIRFPKYLIFYFLFISYNFYSEFVQLERSFQIKYLFTNYLIGAFNYMLIIENLPGLSKKQFEFVMRYSKYILIIAILVIFYQQVIDTNFYVNTSGGEDVVDLNMNKNRLPSIYSWQRTLSHGFCFIPIFFLIVEYLDKKKKKVLIWIVFGVSFAFLTKSRWIMLNSLLIFPVIFMNKKHKISYYLKFIFLIPLIFTFSFYALKLSGVNVSGIIEERILETNKAQIGQQKSATTRILAFEAFNKLYWKQPFFGAGNIKYGMAGTGKQDYELRTILKGRSSQIHVGYLSLLYMYGIVGGILFLAFLYLLLRKLYRNAQVTGMWAPFYGFVGFALANLTLVTFSVYEMGFIIALVANKYYIDSTNSKNGVS